MHSHSICRWHSSFRLQLCSFIPSSILFSNFGSTLKPSEALDRWSTSSTLHHIIEYIMVETLTALIRIMQGPLLYGIGYLVITKLTAQIFENSSFQVRLLLNVKMNQLLMVQFIIWIHLTHSIYKFVFLFIELKNRNVYYLNLLKFQLCSYNYLFTRVWNTRGLWNKLSVMFKGPGWEPGKPRLGNPEDIPEVIFTSTSSF